MFKKKVVKKMVLMADDAKGMWNHIKISSSLCVLELNSQSGEKQLDALCLVAVIAMVFYVPLFDFAMFGWWFLFFSIFGSFSFLLASLRFFYHYFSLFFNKNTLILMHFMLLPFRSLYHSLSFFRSIRNACFA